MNNEWLPITEDILPSLKEPILVTDGSRMYVAHERSSHVWYYSECCGCCTEGITHYMPLPELPK